MELAQNTSQLRFLINEESLLSGYDSCFGSSGTWVYRTQNMQIGTSTGTHGNMKVGPSNLLQFWPFSTVGNKENAVSGIHMIILFTLTLAFLIIGRTFSSKKNRYVLSLSTRVEIWSYAFPMSSDMAVAIHVSLSRVNISCFCNMYTCIMPFIGRI